MRTLTLFFALLASSTAALADIVWRDTPELSFHLATSGQIAELAFDVDFDGANDFQILGQSPLSATPHFWGYGLRAFGTNRFMVEWVDGPGWTGLTHRYSAGELVGPGLSAPQGLTLAYSTPDSDFPDQLLYSWGFEGTTTGYVGFQLVSPLDALTRYGWFELSNTFARNPISLSVSVTRVAYETTPETPIQAGAIPAPAAVLVFLTAPLVIRRRR